METITKKCSKCKEIKSINDFNRDKQKKDGLTSRCKECRLAYRENNREEAKENARNYRKKNKEEVSIKRSIYYKKNKEAIWEYQINYREKNKEYIAERASRYNKSIKGKASLKNAKHKRRSQKKQGDVTTAQLSELQQNAKVCYWCDTSLRNKEVHIDHYVPLAKSGEHTLSNLVVSCRLCNQKKHSKDPIIFANSIGRLL